MKPDFDHSAWKSDTICWFGYGYENEYYRKVNANAASLYVRCPFWVTNKSAIEELNLMVDYSDGYIAYINGVEVARVNVDKETEFPRFNAVATRSHASEIMLGITNPVLGVYLDKTVVNSCLVNGKNILAIHVISDQLRDDLMLFPYIFDLTNYNYVNIWSTFSRYKQLIPDEPTDIPLVIIETDKFGIPNDKNKWVTAWMRIIDNGVGNWNYSSDPANVYNGLVSIRTRGQTSQAFPKKPYRFELIDSLGNDTTVSLLGMPKENDWILSGPFLDKSLIRNKLLYDLGSRMGHYNPRSRFCEVIMNGESDGLYNLTENIKQDKNRVNISKLKETDISGNNVTGGYIFKYDKPADDPEAVTIMDREIVYPDVLQPEQYNYITSFFIDWDSNLNSAIFSDPQKGFRHYVSDSSLVDYIIINEISKNCDAYLNSSYLFKDRDDKDGRAKFGPMWDYDLTFGNSPWQGANILESWQFDQVDRMNITRYLQDRELVKLLQNRWWELRKTTYSNDSIFSFIDELSSQIELACERNYQVWPIIDKEVPWEQYHVNSYEEEITHIKNWLTTRLEWIDNNINKIYYVLESEEIASRSSDFQFKAFPNPFSESLLFSLYSEKASEVRIEVYNLTGQKQLNYEQSNIKGLFNIEAESDKVHQMQKGIYVTKLFIDNVPVKTGKLVKR
jgi:hypothetical protein